MTGEPRRAAPAEVVPACNLPGLRAEMVPGRGAGPDRPVAAGRRAGRARFHRELPREAPRARSVAPAMPEIDDAPRDPFQLCGSTIEGKYRVASVIGDGGFGVVYRGVHLGFGELIAVKCLKLPHALDEKKR